MISEGVFNSNVIVVYWLPRILYSYVCIINDIEAKQNILEIVDICGLIPIRSIYRPFGAKRS